MAIIVDNIRVFNFEGAIRGMRNPFESWEKSDSQFGIENYENCELSWEVIDAWTKTKTNAEYYSDEYEKIYLDFEEWILKQGILSEKDDFFEVAYVGPEDMKLMQKLIKAGSDESKFMRQIMVSMDIKAPWYFLKQLDTYKVGTVANSCSTMHKLTTTPITRECFSFDENIYDLRMIDPVPLSVRLDCIINDLEQLRQMYNMTGDKRYWRALIQLLPNGWMQKRTITLNYQVLRNMYFARRNHKLQEWKDFCSIIEELPYAKELICLEKENK